MAYLPNNRYYLPIQIANRSVWGFTIIVNPHTDLPLVFYPVYYIESSMPACK